MKKTLSRRDFLKGSAAGAAALTAAGLFGSAVSAEEAAEIIEEVKQTPRLIDWEHDEQLICSAINKVAGQEIRSIPYIHWWTFMGWYLAIGESPLSHIVGIRHKLATNQKLEKHEKKFQQENPQYLMMEFMTEEDREYEDFLKNVWNKGD